VRIAPARLVFAAASSPARSYPNCGAAVARELFRAVEPMAIEAAVEAERRYVEAQGKKQRIVELELQQARYEASLAERRYNRLIAVQLENSWEAALCRVETCQATAILSWGHGPDPHPISRLYAKKSAALAGFGEGKIKPPPMGYRFLPGPEKFSPLR
jgi:hypothetical protein